MFVLIVKGHSPFQTSKFKGENLTSDPDLIFQSCFLLSSPLYKNVIFLAESFQIFYSSPLPESKNKLDKSINLLMERNRENKQILLQRNNVWHPCGRMTVRLQACVCAKLLSHVWLFATLWTVARQAPLSMGFSRQEYWSGLPCPPPGDLPYPGIEPASPAPSARQAGSLPLSH